MTGDSAKVLANEANDLSPDHALEIARAWRRALPEFDWNRAEVDRYEGMTLYDANPESGYTTTLHFLNAISGYEGSGPIAAVAILHEAGFGDLQTLRDRVFTSQHCEFTR